MPDELEPDVSEAITTGEDFELDLDGDGRLETIRITETVAIDADGDGTIDIIGGVEVTAADLDGDGTIDVVDERHIGPDDPEDGHRDVLPAG